MGQICWEYPLVNCPIAMENHHAINGKIHYFDWAIFNSHVKFRGYPIWLDDVNNGYMGWINRQIIMVNNGL